MLIVTLQVQTTVSRGRIGMLINLRLDFGPTATRSALYQKGTLYAGGGSGTNSPAYVDAPIEAIQRRAYDDNSSVLWDFISGESFCRLCLRRLLGIY